MTQTPRRGLDGAKIKLIAALLMVLDHIYQVFHVYGAPLWFRLLGRSVAPVFVFFSAEAFHYTRSRRRYMLRLYGGFVLMQVVYRLFLERIVVGGGTVDNNIFETLLLGTIYMWGIDRIKTGARERQAAVCLSGTAALVLPHLAGHAALASAQVGLPLYYVLDCLVPNILVTEGGVFFASLAAVFYLLRESRAAQILALLCYSLYAWVYFAASQWMMVFAAVFLLLYNGTPGKMPKSFFYVFYPAHLYCLVLVAMLPVFAA